MSVAPAQPIPPLVALWVAQMIGTVVIAGVAVAWMGSTGSPFPNADPAWARYALVAAIVGLAPPLLYLPTFKARLDADLLALRQRHGIPEPVVREALRRSLVIGSACCEIPQALGLVHLLLGGQTRWFLGATLATIALRLSFRPFVRAAR